MRFSSTEYKRGDAETMSIKEFVDCASGVVPAPPLAYPIEDAPAVTGIPRTKIFAAVRDKQLTVRKVGRTTIVEHPELLRYVMSLPAKGRQPAEAA
jgi:hypothetical protein